MISAAVPIGEAPSPPPADEASPFQSRSLRHWSRLSRAEHCLCRHDVRARAMLRATLARRPSAACIRARRRPHQRATSGLGTELLSPRHHAARRSVGLFLPPKAAALQDFREFSRHLPSATTMYALRYQKRTSLPLSWATSSANTAATTSCRRAATHASEHLFTHSFILSAIYGMPHYFRFTIMPRTAAIITHSIQARAAYVITRSLFQP